MHIARDTEFRQARTELQLATLPPNVRDYIAGLEIELERAQTKARRRRENIRAMQTKLEVINLQRAFASLCARPVVHELPKRRATG